VEIYNYIYCNYLRIKVEVPGQLVSIKYFQKNEMPRNKHADMTKPLAANLFANKG
jgi:hypothetical protein